MAEVVGLVFSTVTLASLFKTCLEFIEYFELSRTCENDYELACLKLSSLKFRLDLCRQSLSNDKNSHEINEFKAWGEEETVIRRSLQGIAGILGNAESLRDKYNLFPRKTRNISPFFGWGREEIHVPDAHGQYKSRHRRHRFIRLSTTWAIRDKQRFDNFIRDLDFFISNLETISSRTHPVPKSSLKMNPATEPNARDKYAKPDKASNEIILAKRTNDTRSDPHDNNAKQRLLASASQPSNEGTHYPGSSRLVDPAQACMGSVQSSARAYQADGYLFELKRMEDDSQAVQGIVGDAKFPPMSNGQMASFKTELIKDDAQLVSGAIGSYDLQKFFTKGPSKRGR